MLRLILVLTVVGGGCEGSGWVGGAQTPLEECDLSDSEQGEECGPVLDLDIDAGTDLTVEEDAGEEAGEDAGPAECGDGVVQSPEECDDGNYDAHDGCNPDCTDPSCGDGYVDPPEACDSGNDPDGICNGDCTLKCMWHGNVCGEGACPPDMICTVFWRDEETGYACQCMNDHPCGFRVEGSRPGYTPICEGGGCAEGEICDSWSTAETTGIITREIRHCGCRVPPP